MKFNEFGLSKELLEAIEKKGIVDPTEIQEQSIPAIMEGKDVIGESATGSGKTLAFGCGVIEHSQPDEGLQSLILAPTRELAEQVKDAIKEFSKFKHLKIISVYGGVAINPQMDQLTSANVVVATPGRILDHMERGTIDLSKVKTLVLDEVDRMLDMGFIDDVKKIISQCPQERQTLFFSATIAPSIKQLSDRFTKDPIRVKAKNQVDPTKLKQCYYDIDKNKKISLLVNLLKNEHSDLVMVFCNTRRNTDFVVKCLKANKVKATAIHGGLTQNKRSKTLEKFNSSETEILVCTDVAARGLHIDNVTHVYNYEIPNNSEDYVHRIGRTARAGEDGNVLNLICEYDHDNFSRVLNDYSFQIPKEENPQLERVVIPPKDDRRQSSFRGGFKGGNRGGPRRHSGNNRRR